MAWRALRHAMARLAIELVSGPAGVAAILRQGLLGQPCNTPSLPPDIGYADSIPWHIRRAVLLRDRKCAWPKCGRPRLATPHPPRTRLEPHGERDARPGSQPGQSREGAPATRSRSRFQRSW